MMLIIAKWLLVYVLEHKHYFHVDHFLSLTVNGICQSCQDVTPDSACGLQLRGTRINAKCQGIKVAQFGNG